MGSATFYALAAFVTAIATLVTAVAGLRKTSKVHVLVNDRMTSTLARVEQLATALEGSDTAVPPYPPPQAGH